MSAGWFFDRGKTSFVEAATGAYLRQPDEGELRWMGETSTCFLATGEQTGGASTQIAERAKRGESVPLHLHPDDLRGALGAPDRIGPCSAAGGTGWQRSTAS